MPSGLGVENLAVALAPGDRGPMRDASGKHEVAGHPLPFGVGRQSIAKSWGLAPALVSRKVTLARFCTLKILGEKAVSLAVRSRGTSPPVIPSESPAPHGPVGTPLLQRT